MSDREEQHLYGFGDGIWVEDKPRTLSSWAIHYGTTGCLVLSGTRRSNLSQQFLHSQYDQVFRQLDVGECLRRRIPQWRQLLVRITPARTVVGPAQDVCTLGERDRRYAETDRPCERPVPPDRPLDLPVFPRAQHPYAGYNGHRRHTGLVGWLGRTTPTGTIVSYDWDFGDVPKAPGRLSNTCTAASARFRLV